MAGEKKPADQAGLGCPANTAGLYVGAQQAFSATFGDTVALQTVSATFGNATFHQAIRAAFSDNRVGKCVGCEYRESEAKQDLAFHESVLRVF